MKRFLIILSGILMLCSCNGDELMSEFGSIDRIRLENNGNTVFSYNPLNCQLAFDTSNNEFRVSTDSMSDYFLLTLSDIPAVEGQEVKGNLSWTTDIRVETRKNITLRLLKRQGDKIWLWDSYNRIGIQVQILE